MRPPSSQGPTAVFRSAVSLFALAASISIVAACSDSSSPSTVPIITNTSFVGTYALSSVNGLPLQFIDTYTFTDNTLSFDIINTINSASLEVNANNTFRSIVFHRFKMSSLEFSMDSVMTDTTNGAWAQVGSAVTLTFTKAGEVTPQTLVGAWVPPAFLITISDTLRTSLGSVGHVAPYVYRFTK